MDNVFQNDDNVENSFINTIIDENASRDTSGVDGLIQIFVKRKKLIEAIILDTIANQESSRVIKETETYIDENERTLFYFRTIFIHSS